ncbi:MAG TPA: enoyl-CoA hydratase [Rhodospirillaceae bacterium]|nr:enoyl-CoA hydratase [Magnetovibrio sp.]HCS69738.1 enoyl-CoA hydratase [Rhodospirillaceae bacterium]|tara:strand:+ start:5179 stop:6009 length:831 start_codon:yes stop_codon:yes gene_type:complete
MTDNHNSGANEALLLRDDRDGIATLTLNRPDKFNALSTELMGAIQDQLDALAEDRSIKVVVIAANGRAFCAGHDLQEMKAMGGRAPLEALFKQCSRMMTSLTRIPQPVIARVHGVAAAAGCQLVAQCDLAVAAEGVRFSTSGINLGLFCSTPMVAVTRNLPRKQALELLFTGDFIDAETALQYGLINRVVPADRLDRATDELARTIADKSPRAIQFGKALFYKQIEEGLDAAYDLATETIVQNMLHPDAQGGVGAFLEKQPMPEWQDPSKDPKDTP